MSVKVMSAVWECDALDASERLVMLSLADHADDQGRCYPSIARLAKRTSMTDRGVQKVIARLVERGFISIQPNAGQGGANVYTVTATPEHGSPPNTVHPRTRFTTPPNPVRNTPEPRSPKPSVTIKEPSEKKERARRLSPDWFLPMDWGEWALGEGLDRETIRIEADKFKDYWTAKAGKDAAKLDWSATWRNWIRNARDRKHGNGNRIPAASPSGKRIDPALEQIARLAGLGAASGDGRGGVGSPRQEDGPLWMGARPQ